MLALAGCGGGGADGRTGAGETAKLRVALDWFPNPDHVALFYAADHGLYGEQGLSVAFDVPSDATAGLELVATRSFDLAVFYEGDMFFAAQEGLPVVAVASLVPVPLNVLMSLADSNVQGPDDLAGATIGVPGLPFDDAILATIRESQGLTEDDVRSVNVGYDLVPALLTRKVDAVIGAYFNIEGVHVESQTGRPPTITRLDDLGVPTYDELVVVANRERLDEEPRYAEAVRRFLVALAAGVEAARADEAGSIASMEAHTEYSAEEIAGMVPATLPLLASPAGLPPGCLDLAAWRVFGDWMLDRGLLENPVDPSRIATNDYLPGC